MQRPEDEATITFKGNRVVVENSSRSSNLISADLQTLNGLTFGKIGLLGTVKLVINGRLKIKFAMKFRKLLWVIFRGLSI